MIQGVFLSYFDGKLTPPQTVKECGREKNKYEIDFAAVESWEAEETKSLNVGEIGHEKNVEWFCRRIRRKKKLSWIGKFREFVYLNVIYKFKNNVMEFGVVYLWRHLQREE